MNADDITKAVRDRLAEIDDDPAHAEERERLLTMVYGARCEFCRQHECASKRRSWYGDPPCMMGSGLTNVGFWSGETLATDSTLAALAAAGHLKV